MLQGRGENLQFFSKQQEEGSAIVRINDTRPDQLEPRPPVTEEHVLVTPHAAGHDSVGSVLEIAPETRRPFVVEGVQEPVLFQVPENVIGIVAAEVDVPVVVDVGLVPGDRAVVPHRFVELGVVGAYF